MEDVTEVPADARWRVGLVREGNRRVWHVALDPASFAASGDSYVTGGSGRVDAVTGELLTIQPPQRSFTVNPDDWTGSRTQPYPLPTAIP